MTLLLFDLDGTLLDTLEDLCDGVNYALAQFGYPQRSLEEIRSFVGNGAAKLIQKSVPEGENWEPVFPVFQSYYREHCQIKTKPYAGIMEALRDLQQDFAVGIVSNKPDLAVKTLCAHYFPGIYARGESGDCPRKPAPDMVFRAMQAIGAERCIYIGDSEVDVQTAKNAGVPCLSVLWGFRDRAEIPGKIFCESPEVMPAMLREIEKSYGE